MYGAIADLDRALRVLKVAPAPGSPVGAKLPSHSARLYRGQANCVLAQNHEPGISATMVAEIPDSACALTSSHKAEFAAARLALRGAARGAIIELDGVGFFDFLHGQRGVAPNGFELHPVLAVRLIAPPPQ